jgi:hypothetical protein
MARLIASPCTENIFFDQPSALLAFIARTTRAREPIEKTEAWSVGSKLLIWKLASDDEYKACAKKQWKCEGAGSARAREEVQRTEATTAARHWHAGGV